MGTITMEADLEDEEEEEVGERRMRRKGKRRRGEKGKGGVRDEKRGDRSVVRNSSFSKERGGACGTEGWVLEDGSGEGDKQR